MFACACRSAWLRITKSPCTTVPCTGAEYETTGLAAALSGTENEATPRTMAATALVLHCLAKNFKLELRSPSSNSKFCTDDRRSNLAQHPYIRRSASLRIRSKLIPQVQYPELYTITKAD